MSEQVVKVSPVSTADRTTKTYSLSLGRESPVSAILSAVNYIQSLAIESSSAKTISFSETREPLQLTEEINRYFDLLNSTIVAANKTDGERLADYLEESSDFPDNELADNIEKASKEFRQNFKLRSS